MIWQTVILWFCVHEQPDLHEVGFVCMTFWEKERMLKHQQRALFIWVRLNSHAHLLFTSLYCSFWYHITTNMLFFKDFLQPNSRINSSNLSSCWATSRILHVLYRKIVSFSCIWCERLSHQRNHATIWQPLWGWGPMWWTVCALKATHPLDLESGQGE